MRPVNANSRCACARGFHGDRAVPEPGVIFRLGDHRLMLSLIPLTASCGIFKPAIIEGFVENLVEGAATKVIAAPFSCWPCAKSPFLGGNFKNLWRGRKGRSTHQIPHAPEECKTLRVSGQGVFASVILFGMIQIARRGNARMQIPFSILVFRPRFTFLLKSSDIFLRHAEFSLSIKDRSCHPHGHSSAPVSSP